MRLQYNRFEKYKVLFHSDKLEGLAVGDMVNPVQWIVYPSNLCNANCGFCIMKEERKNTRMLPLSTMLKIATDAEAMGIESVIFSGGGEPLTNPYLVQTLRELKSRDITTGLLTNGQLLSEFAIESLDNCRVSVDAATEKTYKKVKGIDKFKALEEKLRLFKNSSCELGLAFLITNDNMNEMYRFCEWATQFNPSFIHLRPMYDADNTMQKYSELLEHKKELIERDFPKAYFRTDKFSGFWTPKLYSKCRATPLIAVLNADGRFSVCQDVFLKFGDYNNHTFEECWYSDEHKESLERIDIGSCPRCVESGYNEIIEQCIINDGLKRSIL